ncbi:uncharacterized protein LOC135835195 isoform X2 [Planococcus citri]|uniref:uncharacterized protein LOC135835195 isoform X2 n=1 Tax=Planococcus citri TaxID=170843 RepID=UPI0031F7DA9C
MIRIQFDTIFLVCTFVLLSQASARFLNTQDPDIIRHYESMWLQVETKKRDEAKAALEKIDTFLSLFEKSLKSTMGDQLKTLQTMQDIIIERKKTVDLANTRDRKNIDTLHAIEKKDDGTTSAPESNSPLFLLDENDVKEIRELYNFWMRLPKLNLPESKKLIKNIEKKGLSLSLFCKSIAEIHVIGNKARKCHDRGDTNGMDVLAKTLDQPNYKKVEEIINETPPPSLDSIANLVHLVRGRFIKID